MKLSRQRSQHDERVIQLCRDGILAGAKKPGRDWIIPAASIAGAKKRNTKRGPVPAKKWK